MKRPISTAQMTVLETNEVKNAERLDPLCAWAIPLLDIATVYD